MFHLSLVLSFIDFLFLSDGILKDIGGSCASALAVDGSIIVYFVVHKRDCGSLSLSYTKVFGQKLLFLHVTHIFDLLVVFNIELLIKTGYCLLELEGCINLLEVDFIVF